MCVLVAGRCFNCLAVVCAGDWVVSLVAWDRFPVLSSSCGCPCLFGCWLFLVISLMGRWSCLVGLVGSVVLGCFRLVRLCVLDGCPGSLFFFVGTFQRARLFYVA